MLRSHWLIAILGMLGLLMIVGVLTQCNIRQSGITARVTASPTQNGVIHENTADVIRVTQTQPILSPTLFPTLPLVAITPTFGPTPTPFPTVPAGIPIVRMGGSGAATNLQAQPGCRGAEPIADLSWSLAAEPGNAQRVDVATFIGGFEAGVFEMTAALHPEETSVVWDGVNPGVLHFWRVLTLHEDGWVTSEVATFSGLVCTPDMVTTPVP